MFTEISKSLAENREFSFGLVHLRLDIPVDILVGSRAGRGICEYWLWGGQRLLTHVKAFETMWPKECGWGCEGYSRKSRAASIELSEEGEPA